MESKRKLQPSILHRTLRILVPVLLFVWVIQSQVGLVSSHGHSHDDHDHDHGHHHGNPQPASFKYSREANEVHAHSHGHDDDHGHSHGSATKQPEHHHHDHAEGPKGERDFNIWLHAISSTLLISAAPFFILFFIKVDNSKEKEKYLKILLSFASGGLLGDAFLHLIPHAIMAKGGDGHGHSHGHSHGGNQEAPKFTDEELEEFHGHDLSVGIWVLVGIVTFLVVEKLIRIANNGHGHSHSHAVESPKKQDDSASGSSKKKKEGSKSPGKKEVAETKSKAKSGPVGEIKVAGYLNLAADFLHNFTDGLAIGASYLAGQPVGMVTTFTVLLHEIPHEIGDFAILIQSGSSRKKAIFLQLLTALGAVAGTIVSLWYGDIGDAATSGVLPFTAGGFIYIATVSVIPDLLQNSTFGQSVKEIIALLFGVYMMVFIAKFE